MSDSSAKGFDQGDFEDPEVTRKAVLWAVRVQAATQVSKAIQLIRFAHRSALSFGILGMLFFLWAGGWSIPELGKAPIILFGTNIIILVLDLTKLKNGRGVSSLLYFGAALLCTSFMIGLGSIVSSFFAVVVVCWGLLGTFSCAALHILEGTRIPFEDSEVEIPDSLK